jgi:copper chaperone CopZ
MKIRILLMLVGVALFGAGALFMLPSEGQGEMAQAELSVRNLSCTSCVQNVQQILGDVVGTGRVDVNLSDGQTLVAFDPERTSPEILAARLSAAGYPAMVARTSTAAEVRQRQLEEEQMAARYVARIGERFISQEMFAREMARRTGTYPHGLVPLAARSAVWQQVLQRHLLLEAVERAGIVVEEGAIDQELARLHGMAGFAAKAEKLGGQEGFRQMLREELAISRLIETQVAADEFGPQRQSRLEAWYRGLVEATPVTIFDPQLKSALQGGCGSGCCSPKAS